MRSFSKQKKINKILKKQKFKFFQIFKFIEQKKKIKIFINYYSHNIHHNTQSNSIP